ncbi:hypothetical protein DL240_00425 [Lujinxingia litoralis]|uniref:Uncharacterized protein n=1 Tax=Lujinxingia litoralis TaxID=2211119 RepID=A0A328CCZ3_9DELT|nr:hypothetical protein [Lujinxingia litoralis]RAL24709.1 hypothetical protein DL240_00425 [Lujinxingia litoralis]
MRRLFPFAFAAALLLSLPGCTLIRYVDPPPGPGEEPDPKVVDILVLVDLPRGAANLMTGYSRFLGHLELAMQEYNIQTRRVGVAPLYRRQGDTPPLIYGRGAQVSAGSSLGSESSVGGSLGSESDPSDNLPDERPVDGEEPTVDPSTGGGGPGQLLDLSQTLLYYISDEGQRHLDQQSDGVGENLAALGLDLDRAAIFDPTGVGSDSSAYFHEAADGFVVVYLSASARRCAHQSAACQLNGQSPANYFTHESGELASWLNLPGPSGLPAERIFHLSVATPEGISFERFADQCLAEPNFPAATLDVMEPSPDAYFAPLLDGLRTKGASGYNIDVCTALSSRSERAALTAASTLERALR